MFSKFISNQHQFMRVLYIVAPSLTNEHMSN
uniref:Uncharacterized protein n=1 Tax=Arundo donax TaxID=35708 RepID=A0A0A8ZVP0_ARUDO